MYCYILTYIKDDLRDLLLPFC